MKILNPSSLIRAFKENRVSRTQQSLYFFISVLCLMMHLTVFSLAPWLYKTIIYVVKKYIEDQTRQQQLVIHIYTYADQWFTLFTMMLSLLGIGLCYCSNKDRKKFLERLIPLGCTINLHMLLPTFILVGGIIGASCLHFGLQLQQLVADFQTTNPGILSFFGRIIKRASLLPTVLDNLQLLNRAVKIFVQFNRVNEYVYLFAHIFRLISVIVFFAKIRNALNRITNV